MLTLCRRRSTWTCELWYSWTFFNSFNFNFTGSWTFCSSVSSVHEHSVYVELHEQCTNSEVHEHVPWELIEHYAKSEVHGYRVVNLWVAFPWLPADEDARTSCGDAAEVASETEDIREVSVSSSTNFTFNDFSYMYRLQLSFTIVQARSKTMSSMHAPLQHYKCS